MQSFKTQLQQSPEIKHLLDFYGQWGQDDKILQSQSITKSNEYDAIRLSLYVMDIFLKSSTVDDVIAGLSKNYNEAGFEFKGIASDAKTLNHLKVNITILLTLKKQFHDTFKDQPNNKLMLLFLLHDLGKSVKFLKNELGMQDADINKASAAENERFLQEWFEKEGNSKTREQFYAAIKWINVFDGLGYNPAKLLERGYADQLKLVEDIVAFHGQNKKKLNIQSMNLLFYNLAQHMNLPQDFKFLINENTKTESWASLPFAQQRHAVMLMFCCAFVYIKNQNPVEVRKEFMRLWESAKYQEVTNKMTQFMIANMFSDKPVLLYNITGLMHHPVTRQGSHFANGGTVEELFTCFIPYIMDIFEKVHKDPAKKDIVVGTYAFNIFQMMQGIEVVPTMADAIYRDSSDKMPAIDYVANFKVDYLSKLAEVQLSAKKIVQEKLTATRQQPFSATANSSALFTNKPLEQRSTKETAETRLGQVMLGLQH